MSNLPELIQRTWWSGRIYFHCTGCRTNGTGDHVPGSDECEELRRERIISQAD